MNSWQGDAGPSLSSGRPQCNLQAAAGAGLVRAGLVLKDGANVLALQLGAPVQRDQLDQDGDTVHATAELTREVHRRARGSPGGQQVVHDQDALSALDRIAVDLEAVGAVFELVTDPHR